MQPEANPRVYDVLLTATRRRRRALAALTLAAAVAHAAPRPDAAETPQPSRADIIAAALRDAEQAVQRELPLLADAGARAESWGRLAMLHHAQNRLDEAAAAYRLALGESAAARWRYLLAVVHGERGDLDAAIAEYRRALAAEPGRMQTAYRLGLALLARGDHRAAAAALGKALELAPDSAAVLLALGSAAAAGEDWPRARELLERAAALAPSAGRIAYQLAVAHRQLGNLEQARLWLAKRNEVAPPVDDPLLLEVARLSLSPAFFLDAGERAWQRGERDDALAAWRNAAALAPDDLRAGLVLASALEQLGRMDAARREVRRVLAGHPQSARAWYLLALVLRGDAEPDTAHSAAERSLELTDDETTRALLAALDMRMRRFEAAAGHYQTLAMLRPDAAYYQYWLGLARLAAGDCPAARPALLTATEAQPNWGQAHIVRARADALCGGDAERAAAWRRARQLVAAQDDADTRITLAFAALGVGRLEEARRLAAPAEPHGDARMLLDALDAGAMPAMPFAADSAWWLPDELR